MSGLSIAVLMDSTVNPTPTYCQAAGSIEISLLRLRRREKKPKLIIGVPPAPDHDNSAKSTNFLQILSQQSPPAQSNLAKSLTDPEPQEQYIIRRHKELRISSAPEGGRHSSPA
jgi:hypothetical protein